MLIGGEDNRALSMMSTSELYDLLFDADKMKSDRKRKANTDDEEPAMVCFAYSPHNKTLKQKMLMLSDDCGDNDILRDLL